MEEKRLMPLSRKNPYVKVYVGLANRKYKNIGECLIKDTNSLFNTT
jgi:hypothetical protein